jgi:hypothetical protein
VEASSKPELSDSTDDCIMSFRNASSMMACAALYDLFHQALLHGMNYEEQCGNQQ